MTASGSSQRYDSLPIRTPDGVEFSLPLAGPFSRLMAMVVDLMITSAAAKLVDAALEPFRLWNPDFASGAALILYFLISMLYGIVCEWRLHGQTLGKRIFKLRVVDAGGLRLEPSQIILRNLLRLVDGLPAFYLLGGITALLNTKMQRLGDIAAGTAVVRIATLSQPDLAQILGSKYNSLLEHRHLCARLRQKVTPELAALALHALIRREQLDPASRLAVFADLAAYLRRAVEFPPEVNEALGDEQYVRNAVEVLYKR
jgi:uncharacterized RDD family membrane protein YckC